MLDRQGLANYRLDVARRSLRDQVHEPEFALIVDPRVPQGVAVWGRVIMLARALSSPANKLMLANDAAWTAIWRELHIPPGQFAARMHYPAWLEGPHADNRSEALVLTVDRAADNFYDSAVVPNAAEGAAAVEAGREAPAFTAERFNFDTIIESAVEWLGLTGGAAEIGAPPGEPLTRRDAITTIHSGRHRNVPAGGIWGHSTVPIHHSSAVKRSRFQTDRHRFSHLHH